jgi:predicted permease
MRTMALLTDLGQDLRYALRTLRRSPGSTALVALSLAVGIAANVTVFSLINALLLRPLPVREPERLALLSEGLGSGRVNSLPTRNGRLRAFSYPIQERLRDDPSFEGLAAEDSWSDRALVARSTPGAESTSDRGLAVTANYFSVLGLQPVHGRLFAAGDQTAPGADRVLVLGHHYWQRRFSGDPGVVGARLTINGKPYQVIGVVPPGFTGIHPGEAIDFWVPLTMQGELHREGPLLADRSTAWLHLIGRLRPGVSMSAAEAGLNVALGRHLTEIQPTLDQPDRQKIERREVRIGLQPGGRGASFLRRDFREPLLVLQAGVALLLLIVALNVSHLLLARGISRQREMTIRIALGASRFRLARQLSTEGILLASVSVAAADLLSRWLIDGLLALAVDGETARALAVGGDGRVWLFAAGLSVLTAVLVGLVPAVQSWRRDLQTDLRAGARAVTTTRRRLGRWLLISQMAVSLVLLVGAGLLWGTLRSLRQVDTGFRRDHLMLAELDFRFVDLTDQQKEGVYDELLRRVSALPGVASASLAIHEILDSDRWTTTISFAGATSPINPGPHAFVVTPGYFDTVGMTIVRGREFGRGDRTGAGAVAIVNETLARLISDGDVLGKRFRFGHPSSPAPADIEVIGVVRDAKINSLREKPRPTVYCPLAQSLDSGVNNLQVRMLADSGNLPGQVRSVVATVHPALRIANVRTVDAAMDQSLRQERLLATLSSAFGLTAVFLVCLGLYGVIAQWAAQRTQEIGVRMALGATGRGVQWLVMRQAFLLVLAGVALGLPAAAAAARVIRGLLYGVAPFHPATLTAAVSSLLLVGAAAAYLPARRASRIDPMTALRSE